MPLEVVGKCEYILVNALAKLYLNIFKSAFTLLHITVAFIIPQKRLAK